MSDSLDIVEDLENQEKEPLNLAYDDETVVWEGRPSQWVNFSTFVFWTLVGMASFIFMAVWNSQMSQEYSALIGTSVVACLWLVIAMSVLNILIPFLTTHFERTVITRNKIKESKGITRLFQVDRFAEISDIKDIQSPAAGLLAIWNLASIKILTKDEDQPVINIRAIRNRDELINKLLPIWRELKIERKGYFGSDN